MRTVMSVSRTPGVEDRIRKRQVGHYCSGCSDLCCFVERSSRLALQRALITAPVWQPSRTAEMFMLAWAASTRRLT